MGLGLAIAAVHLSTSQGCGCPVLGTDRPQQAQDGPLCLQDVGVETGGRLWVLLLELKRPELWSEPTHHG